MRRLAVIIIVGFGTSAGKNAWASNWNPVNPSPSSGVARKIETNEVLMPAAPKWLTASRVSNITQKTQDYLEWNIRKIKVYWYINQSKFQEAHGIGPRVRAATRKGDMTIHLGPQVNQENFERVFSHELVHIILAQKYKAAIPNWLEEGLANYVAKMKSDNGFVVDYKYLDKETPVDVRSLSHGILGSVSPRYHYSASTAVMEMIAAKCSATDLLQLSVGHKLDTHLQHYCQIKDLNADFRKWVHERAKSPPASSGKKHWWDKYKYK